MPRIARLLAAALLALPLLGACGIIASESLPEPPSEADARAFLGRVVDAALARDLDRMCAIAGSICDSVAEDSGGLAAVPNDPPIVAGARLIPNRGTTTGGTAGGRLLVLCGTDGLGRPYRTEMLVSRDPDGSLYAINGVFWSGAGLAVANDTGSPSGGAGIDCP
jgi:hypothetical protein